MATNNSEIDDKKYIDQLLANGERVTLECKKPEKMCHIRCGKLIPLLPILMAE